MIVSFIATLALGASVVCFDSGGGGQIQVRFPAAAEEQIYELLRFGRERNLRITVEVEDAE